MPLPRPAHRLLAVLSAIMVGCGGGGDGPTAPPPAVAVSVSPGSSSVNAGGTQSFTASVANARTGAVTWTASGGTIAPSGTTAIWTAPFTGGSYTITATSTDDATKSASATVMVAAIGVSIDVSTVTVASGATRSFTATVMGAANTAVQWTASVGTLGATSGTTVSWTAPTTGGSATVTATSVADPTRSASATVTVTPVSVAIAPAIATIGAAGSAALVATVLGGVDSSVTWQASGGTVVGTGRAVTWQAPVAAGTYTIRAISVLDPSRADSARVTVTPVSVAIAPTTSTLFRGQPVTLTATVSGAAPGRDSVTWGGTCGTGTATGAAAATYSIAAPTAPGPCTVTATSRLDASRTASATLTVRADWLANNTADVSDGACTWSHCTLREALLAANATNDVDTIRLDLSPPAAIAAITSARPRTGTTASQLLTGTITLTSALPIISTPMTIVGPGAAQLTIDAAASTGAQRRVLEVNGAVAVSISGLTLRGGVADEAAGLRLNGNATVSATDLTIRNNLALITGGGGIGIRGGSTLTLTNSLVTDNQADNASVIGAGGIGVVQAGTLIMRGGSVTNNRAAVGGGGGLGAEFGVLRLENVNVSGNQCGQGGGGIAAWSGSTLEVTGGVVRDNSSTTAVGGGFLIGAATTGSSDRTTATITGTLIQDNVAVLQGGGIQVTRNAQVTMSDLRIVGNRLTSTQTIANSGIIGAGINIGSTVTATLTRSLVSGNTMATVTGVGASDGGGGIAVSGFVAAANLTIVQSTIAGNTTGNNGGGLFVFNFGAVTMQNSTISGNSAATGAGILARRPVTITGSTIAANTATVSGGGLLLNTGGSVSATNMLLAGNLSNGAASNCTSTGGAPFTSGGSNLGDDATCAWMVQAGDRANTVAGLQGTLGNNGGPTPTHALLMGSAAINGGLAQSCATTDQRGAPRVGVCDIGAFEFGGTPPVNASLQRIWRASDVRSLQPRRSVTAPVAKPDTIDWLVIDRAAGPIPR